MDIMLKPRQTERVRGQKKKKKTIAQQVNDSIVWLFKEYIQDYCLYQN